MSTGFLHIFFSLTYSQPRYHCLIYSLIGKRRKKKLWNTLFDEFCFFFFFLCALCSSSATVAIRIRLEQFFFLHSVVVVHFEHFFSSCVFALLIFKFIIRVIFRRDINIEEIDIGFRILYNIHKYYMRYISFVSFSLLIFSRHFGSIICFMFKHEMLVWEEK